MNNKYVRVMDGLKSNAGGFEYKLDEINRNIELCFSLCVVYTNPSSYYLRLIFSIL